MLVPSRSEASFRTHPLRTFQNYFQGHVVEIISFFNHHKFFPRTAIERSFNISSKLMPDDITLPQLQMTINYCQSLKQNGWYSKFPRDYISTSLLDGADGLLARQLDLASPEGAMKDVIADRLSEAVISKFITEERAKYKGCPKNLKKDLQTAFQLSTLTKAACEMCNLKTKEGGIGSMIERRRILFNSLFDLMLLSKISSKDGFLKRKLLEKVDKINSFLINSSISGAKKRIDAIAIVEQSSGTGWNNQNLNDPDSSAAIEARKYAAIVFMDGIIDIDILNVLNNLEPGKITFPSFQDLSNNYPYIGSSLDTIQDFLNVALSMC